MDSSFIPASIQILWNEWNIRGFMILSIFMQLVLTLAAPLRKKTSNGFVIFVVWSAYVLADSVALFAFGLISNAGCRQSQSNMQVDSDVLALWAGFLLIHLGGPDTITAFSMEDNALWMRHLIGLFAQFSVFMYIFLKTLPHNRLRVPTILIVVAGVIKYGQRTHALYLASLDNLKDSIKRTKDGDSRRTDQHSHDMIKGLIVDIMPDLSKCNECRATIRHSTDDMVLTTILRELNFLYEVLYTKIEEENSRWGLFNRSIASSSGLVAFVLFILVNKDEFHGVDVAITYALLVGIFVLNVASIVMFSTSDLPYISFVSFLLLLLGHGVFPYLVGYALYSTIRCLSRGTAVEDFISKEWSERMGSFNLLSYCFKQSSSRKYRKQCFIWRKVAETRHTSKVVFNSYLWKSVFEDLKTKTQDPYDEGRMRQLYKARGGGVLEERSCLELIHYINNFEYDHTLLIWHVATGICYNLDGESGNANEEKGFSKILSEYMVYLLVRQPKLLFPVAGIGHIRYKDTCDEVQQLARELRAPNMREFCVSILRASIETNHGTYSVLKDGCTLARLLRERSNRWEIIFKVWVELLTYAAGHCRATSHARLVSEGGEFISLVWVLMADLGIFAKFPVE